MPLLARKKMYKTLPQCLADRVIQKARVSHVALSTTVDRTLEDVEVARTNLRSNREASTKFQMPAAAEFRGNSYSTFRLRPRTPLTAISDESDNDTSSNQSFAGTPSPRATPSPLLTQQNPDDTQQDAELNSTLELLMRPLPKFTRTSPRITVSLDNVDLWEESDTDSETTKDSNSVSGFDRINGVVINPRKTFDFSELRRPRSAFITGDKSDLPIPHPPLKQVTCPGNEESLKRPRPRLPRKVKPVSRKNDVSGCVKENFSLKPAFTNFVDSDSGLNSSGECQIKVPKCSSQKDESYSEDGAQSKHVEAQADECNASAEKHSNQSARQRRRVKFSQLVTVQDGDVSSKEMLRSSNNSASVIKKKYLSGLRPKAPPSIKDSATESPWRPSHLEQLAF